MDVCSLLKLWGRDISTSAAHVLWGVWWKLAHWLKNVNSNQCEELRSHTWSRAITSTCRRMCPSTLDSSELSTRVLLKRPMGWALPSFWKCQKKLPLHGQTLFHSLLSLSLSLSLSPVLFTRMRVCKWRDSRNLPGPPLHRNLWSGPQTEKVKRVLVCVCVCVFMGMYMDHSGFTLCFWPNEVPVNYRVGSARRSSGLAGERRGVKMKEVEEAWRTTINTNMRMESWNYTR